ncbi:adenosylmethionine decarboxylase [Parashewanella spongiae]|uniref:Adenosylmethionine decarboxylase n=1 Tax=Parashewanella spongiae TaxID=342950 RepID=A0A3A6TXL2_9GAMM|nr:adenosylmethionine decarboxylase [Parashewanella spongiae]MCL1076854.1 S-adenosylmethionine decarboxylase proenzyme [Parashewanella spongiae]RJY19222.1 adenosylmethionine decarboxylase [Parashewanella spongiae]
MFYEASEKKVEIIVSQNSDSLRDYSVSFWKHIVEQANAEVLSVTTNECCDAYILSESSLFVWEDRFLMLTCGNTELINSVMTFIDEIGHELIEFVRYQRKNEHRAHLQVTTFNADVEKLKSQLSGEAFLIGDAGGHHHYLFTTEKKTPEYKKPACTELLMYQISGEFSDYLRRSCQTKENIRNFLDLSTDFAEFIIDDHKFDPVGYSINGIKGEKYFTVHITPQEPNSYVSFETNIDLIQSSNHILQKLIMLFNPKTWDVIGFNSTHNLPVSFESDKNTNSYDLTVLSGDDVSFKYHQFPACQKITVELI